MLGAFTVKDIFAGVVAIGCIVLIALGLDGEVKALLGVIIGYYFGTTVVPAALSKIKKQD